MAAARADRHSIGRRTEPCRAATSRARLQEPAGLRGGHPDRDIECVRPCRRTDRAPSSHQPSPWSRPSRRESLVRHYQSQRALRRGCGGSCLDLEEKANRLPPSQQEWNSFPLWAPDFVPSLGSFGCQSTGLQMQELSGVPRNIGAFSVHLFAPVSASQRIIRTWPVISVGLGLLAGSTSPAISRLSPGNLAD